MKKKWNILLAILFSWQVGFSQTEETNIEIQTFTLEEATNFAVEHSFSTKLSSAEVKIAEQKVKETVAIGLPQINGTADYKNMLDLPVSLIPGEIFGQPGQMIEASFGTQHNSSFGITLNQLIFSGEYIVGLQATTIYKNISIKQNKKTEQDIKESVSKSYFLVLISNESYRILDSTLININQLLDEAKEIHKQGLSDDISVDQLTLTKKNIEKSKESFERMIEVSNRLLKFQMGIDFNTEIKLSNSLNDFIDKNKLNSLCLEEFNVNNNIDYEIADLNVVVNQNLLKYEKSTYLPQLAGFLSYSRSGMNDDFGKLFKPNWYPTTVVGLQLNVPIFSSGTRRSKVQQAKLNLEKAEIIKEQSFQGLHTDVLQKKSDLRTALNSYNYEVENMELAKKIYDKTLEKFKQGMASSADLTQVQNQYLTTQSSYFQAMIEMLNKKVELEKLLF